jgi:quercetin dioxygenase-like cupin family protein
MQWNPKWTLVGVGSLVLSAALSVPNAVRATPASGFSGVTTAVGRFEELDVLNHAFPYDFGEAQVDRWMSAQKTKGPSDLYVQSNVWQPGGYTGWHTHPGHSLIIVTFGTITVYDGQDPSCAARTYTVGQGFVDEGGDHVHLIANEDPALEARTIAVQITPAGATRRVDAAAPAACQ